MALTPRLCVCVRTRACARMHAMYVYEHQRLLVVEVKRNLVNVPYIYSPCLPIFYFVFKNAIIKMSQDTESSCCKSISSLLIQQIHGGVINFHVIVTLEKFSWSHFKIECSICLSIMMMKKDKEDENNETTNKNCNNEAFIESNRNYF